MVSEQSGCGEKPLKRLVSSTLLLAILVLTTGGCAALLRPASRRAVRGTADSVVRAFFRQEDPRTAEAAAPAFLVLLDGLAMDNPEDDQIQLSAARAYAAFAGAFVEQEEPDRAHLLFRRAARYSGSTVPLTMNGPVMDLEEELETVGSENASGLYWLAMSLAGAARTAPAEGQSEALVDLTRAVRLMERVHSLAPETEGRGADLFLGAYYATIPAGVGRDLDRSRRHFESAMEAGGLLVQVIYARTYARATFDRELFEGALRAVLESPVEPARALLDAVARREAERLMGRVDEYFD